MNNNEITNSILLSIKHLLGINPDMKEFDVDITIQINSAINVLTQLGVGPSSGFFITGDSETYSNFLENVDPINYQMIKTYLFCKTKLGFDPPTNSSVLESYKQIIKETEWRLNAQAEFIDGGET